MLIAKLKRTRKSFASGVCFGGVLIFAGIRRGNVSVNNFPEVMRSARIDLAGHLSGDFSEEDWRQILELAEQKWRLRSVDLGGDPLAAWKDVVLDFHQHGHWGFVLGAPQKRPKNKKQKNLGVTFIWMAFQTFVISKIAVVWLGQIYARSGEARDAFYLWFAVALVVGNFGFFLWRNRHHRDDENKA